MTETQSWGRPVPANGVDVLALDLGATATGFASALRCGVKRLDQKLERYAGMRTERHRIICRRWHDWLCDELHATKAGVVVAECAGRHSNAGSQGAMRGVLLLVCDLRRVIVQEVHPSTWQAFARREMPSWRKGDLADALAIRAWWLATGHDRIEVAA